MPELFSEHGGYRRLDTFMLATLVYYATADFCHAFIASGRQQEQMTQAARSGRQNIAEGSERSSTSTEMEIKLTDVARASLVELMLDYEDFINLRGGRPWRDDAPESLSIRAIRLKRLDCEKNTAHEFSAAAAENRALFAEWLESGDPLTRANALARLCQRAVWLLRKQLDALGQKFVEEGGFREKMTRARIEARDAAEEREAPKCPECGKPMRKRMARTGKNAGKEFWGCPGFGEGCKGTLPVVEGNRPKSTGVD